MTARSVASAFVVLLLAGAIGSPNAAAQDRQDEPDTVASPDATVYVDGIACPFCAYGLEKKLKELDAVRKLEVQLEDGRVLIAYEDGASLTKEEIQTAVKNAGFEARKIEFAEDTSAGTPSP